MRKQVTKRLNSNLSVRWLSWLLRTVYVQSAHASVFVPGHTRLYQIVLGCTRLYQALWRTSLFEHFIKFGICGRSLCSFAHKASNLRRPGNCRRGQSCMLQGCKFTHPRDLFPGTNMTFYMKCELEKELVRERMGWNWMEG